MPVGPPPHLLDCPQKLVTGTSSPKVINITQNVSTNLNHSSLYKTETQTSPRSILSKTKGRDIGSAAKASQLLHVPLTLFFNIYLFIYLFILAGS